MKKFVLSALLAAIAVLCCLGGVAFAEEQQAVDYKTTDIYQFLEYFSETYPDRHGTKMEIEAANFLKEQFQLAVAPVGGSAEIITVTNGATPVCYNVEAVIKAATPTDKQIVVGAHFDSTGRGANDNASGVTALFFTLKQLADGTHSFPFNLVFVAFGGEESGMSGSASYVAGMSSVKKQDTLLMINIDSIANGDNLYLTCENKKTTLANFILANAKGQAEILEKPYAVGTYPMDSFGYGYYERVQASDHTPFRLAQIPVAFFFSGNFLGWDYVESTNPNKQVMNTPNDTVASLDVLSGSAFVEKIDTVTQTLCQVLTSEEFLPVAEGARGELLNNSVLFNVWWPRLAVAGCALILAVFAILYNRRLVKKSIMGTAEIKNDKVFSRPDAEDIFSFAGDDKKDGPDVDDIFSFKK